MGRPGSVAIVGVGHTSYGRLPDYDAYELGIEPGGLRTGMPVEAAFEEIAPDVVLLKFKPRKESA